MKYCLSQRDSPRAQEICHYIPRLKSQYSHSQLPKNVMFPISLILVPIKLVLVPIKLVLVPSWVPSGGAGCGGSGCGGAGCGGAGCGSAGCGGAGCGSAWCGSAGFGGAVCGCAGWLGCTGRACHTFGSLVAGF